MKQQGELWRFARHRRGRWLNNRVEQDHRRIKRLTRPMLGFQGFWTAKRTLAGIEAMAMLAKGQVRAVPRGDMPAQRALYSKSSALRPERDEANRQRAPHSPMQQILEHSLHYLRRFGLRYCPSVDSPVHFQVLLTVRGDSEG